MCTRAETVLTTTSMTTVSVSMRSAQAACRSPESMKRITGTVKAWVSGKATVMKAIHDRTATITIRPEVTNSDALAPIERPNRPAIRKPRRGRKTMA
jgi:hypothetical protein